MKILISYDNMLPYTTGNYFYYAFDKITDTKWCHPSNLDKLRPQDYDLFIKIDDGLYFHQWPSELKPSLYYIIDSHIDNETWRLDTIKKGDFDYLVTAQKDGSSQLGIQAEWIPLGCDYEKHYRNAGGKKYDVCFIGNFHSIYRDGRIDYVHALFKKFQNFYYGNRSFLEMAEKFSASRIVFNHSLNNDINMRIFEACCSGSMQLTSRIKDNGFNELFEEDKHLVMYDSIDEMIDKAGFYLKNEEKREKIAKAGFEHVLKEHTYLNRSKEILKYVKRRNKGG